MKIKEMIEIINREIGRPVVKDNGKKNTCKSI